MTPRKQNCRAIESAKLEDVSLMKDGTIELGLSDVRYSGSHTVSSLSDPSPLTFDDLIDLWDKIRSEEPVPKEIRIHPSGYRKLRDWLVEVRSRDITRLDLDRVNTFGTYGVPILLDKTLKKNHWKAIDSLGNVMNEGVV